MAKVRVEFPLGEVCSHLESLIGLGLIPKPEIDPRGIMGKEKWNAQGLEGKAYVEVDQVIADMLVKRMTRLRSRIVALKGG